MLETNVVGKVFPHSIHLPSENKHNDIMSFSKLSLLLAPSKKSTIKKRKLAFSSNILLPPRELTLHL